MAASKATTVDAGGRDLRVSNPDRVIFPKTKRTGEVTKLDVVNYYLAVGEGIQHAVVVGRSTQAVGASRTKIDHSPYDAKSSGDSGAKDLRVLGQSKLGVPAVRTRSRRATTTRHVWT